MQLLMPEAFILSHKHQKKEIFIVQSVMMVKAIHILSLDIHRVVPEETHQTKEMCIYVYMCECVCVCIHIHVHMSECVYIFTLFIYLFIIYLLLNLLR